jgi:hypothetical protein
MSVSETEKSLRRRVLYNSIPSGTPEEVIQRAIDLLENEFGDQPEIQYIKLVKRLRQSINHEAFAAKNLLGKMVMLRNKPVQQIGPDPAEGNLGRRAAPSRPTRPVAKVANQDPRSLVFNTMLQHIADAVAKKNPENLVSLRKRFLEAAVKLKMSHECGKQLVSWARSETAAPNISGPDEDLHKIINTAFVWMCEKFGPVDADKLLLYSVQRTEQLPEAYDHPPRDFL